MKRVCTAQPLGVAENAAFVISIDSIDFEDLKADDLGLWKGTGTKKTYFRFLSSGTIRFMSRKPKNDNMKYYVLTRRYFIHSTYSKFHRLIAGATCVE